VAHAEYSGKNLCQTLGEKYQGKPAWPGMAPQVDHPGALMEFPQTGKSGGGCALQGGGFSLAGGLLGGGAIPPVQALDSFLPLVVR
jgi:hypothetical protein